MTREEAIDKIAYMKEAPYFVDALVGLGVLKLEKKAVPPAASVIALEISDIATMPHARADKIIEGLSRYGYMISIRDG